MKTTKHGKRTKIRIGFIGQGVVGKAIADDLEHRGFEVIRYALEKQYARNKQHIRECDVTFIAVPTPTIRGKQDLSALRESIALLNAKNKTAVIKSTILPYTTDMLQKEFRNVLLVHSPEFLIANNAREDAAKPFMNVVGIPTQRLRKKETDEKIACIVSLLPHAPATIVCTPVEAEVIKYCHNIHGYFQIVFWNMMHDYARTFSADWHMVKKAIDADPMISKYYTNPIHKNGRGAGGHCFIKDYAAFRTNFIKTNERDSLAQSIFRLVERKNLMLLGDSQKDQELVRHVYGKKHHTRRQNKQKS